MGILFDTVDLYACGNEWGLSESGNLLLGTECEGANVKVLAEKGNYYTL